MLSESNAMCCIMSTTTNCIGIHNNTISSAAVLQYVICIQLEPQFFHRALICLAKSVLRVANFSADPRGKTKRATY